MKKMVAITFLTVMLTMSALAGGAYLGARSYIDPTLKDLNSAVAAIQPEAQKRLMPHVRELQALRDLGTFYIPSVLFLAGLTATLVLSLFLRRLTDRGAVIPEERPGRVQVESSAEEERAPEAVADDPMHIGACRLMSILQDSGRLIDFLQEDITGYPDAQIGAAVRYIHDDCRDALRECITLAPVMSENEGEAVVVSEGFDPSEIRLTGHITGGPPFEGILQHSGWKVTRIGLPAPPKGQKHTVIVPAEVEIGETT